MDMPYETKQYELFNFKDIHYLITHPVGLRLTHRYSDITEGGTGDAVPLSHLGGAKDSVTFATLSSVLRHDTSLDTQKREYYIQTLVTIFNKYVGSDYDKLDNMPALILAYAHVLRIWSPDIEPSIAERVLPRNEEALLCKIYRMSDAALFPSLIFDPESQYYPDLPSLRLHLTSDFNQLLEKRLKMNRSYYAPSGPMYYLLLRSPDSSRYTDGYDFSAYPLGKAGRKSFTSQEVMSYHAVEGKSPDESLELIWTWLKQQCTANTSSQLRPSPSYWQQCVEFCHHHKQTLVLAGGIVFAGGGLGIKMLRSQADYAEAAMPSPIEL